MNSAIPELGAGGVKTVVTNSEHGPAVIERRRNASGEYEMVFQVGVYFGAEPAKSFLNEMPVRFRIVDPDEVYHVPLLMSRWAYNTYRGN